MKLKNIIFCILVSFLGTAFSTQITASSWVVANSSGEIVSGKNTQDVRSIASLTKLMTAMVFLDAIPNPDKKQKKLLRQAISFSDNKSAKKLCESYPGGYRSCIDRMNKKAKWLGLSHTKFLEPTGLSVFNISTAEELVTIVSESSKYKLIEEYSNDKTRNTNPTVSKYHYSVSKTGYIRAAGGCIAVMLDDIIIVILGSQNTATRIRELEYLKRQHID